MSIVGGAIIPVVVSAIGDACRLSVAMLVAVPCLAFCAWYGFAGSKIGFRGGVTIMSDLKVVDSHFQACGTSIRRAFPGSTAPTAPSRTPTR